MAVMDRGNYREDDGMYGAPYHGMPPVSPVTPYTKCRDLFVNLNNEKRKAKPDAAEIKWIQEQIDCFPHDVQCAAFDFVVDNNGWIEPELTMTDTTGRPQRASQPCCAYHAAYNYKECASDECT